MKETRLSLHGCFCCNKYGNFIQGCVWTFCGKTKFCKNDVWVCVDKVTAAEHLKLNLRELESENGHGT